MHAKHPDHKTLTIRVPLPWTLWIEELRLADRSDSISQLIDHALRSYARELHFPQPPMDRLHWHAAQEKGTDG